MQDLQGNYDDQLNQVSKAGFAPLQGGQYLRNRSARNKRELEDENKNQQDDMEGILSPKGVRHNKNQSYMHPVIEEQHSDDEEVLPEQMEEKRLGSLMKGNIPKRKATDKKQEKGNKRITQGTEDTGQKASTHDSSTKQEDQGSYAKITKEVLAAFEISTKQSLNQRIEKYLFECYATPADDEELIEKMESEDEEQDSESYESEEESFNRGASPNTQIKRGYQSKVLADNKRAKRKLNY